MKRRLYFMLPNIHHARKMLDILLLARIEESNMHFYAKEGTLPDDMPEANLIQKTDVMHGLETGMMIGGFSGLIAGGLFMLFPPDNFILMVMILMTSTILGAILGSWMSARQASSIPNSKLLRFKEGINNGEVLLMVDVPLARVKAIQQLIANRSPDASFNGMEIHLPVVS